MTMELRPLMDIHFDLETPLEVGAGPFGKRVIYEVTGGAFTGERLRGTVLPGGGDWVLFDAEGEHAAQAPHPTPVLSTCAGSDAPPDSVRETCPRATDMTTVAQGAFRRFVHSVDVTNGTSLSVTL